MKSQLSGFKELDQILKELPDRVQKRELQNAANAGGRVALAAVKQSAPSGWAGESMKQQSAASKKYGTLKRNLRMQSLRRLPKTAKGVRIWTGNAFWAVFYELGTARQPARPFFRTALDSAHGAALKAMIERLAKGIETQSAALAGTYKTAKKALGIR